MRIIRADQDSVNTQSHSICTRTELMPHFQQKTHKREPGPPTRSPAKTAKVTPDEEAVFFCEEPTRLSGTPMHTSPMLPCSTATNDRTTWTTSNQTRRQQNPECQQKRTQGEHLDCNNRHENREGERKGPHLHQRRCGKAAARKVSEPSLTTTEDSNQAIILVTTPAPTVRPPSRIANFTPSSIAIGFISSTAKVTRSPGITISTSAGKVIEPVTSVVRK